VEFQHDYLGCVSLSHTGMRVDGVNHKIIGTGQTYTNELYFIGTRENPSSTGICGVLPQNPFGTFTLQDYSSGNYVAASSANTNVTATLTSASGAAIFNSSFVPNAGTLQLTSTGMYVTADISGDYALAAIRTVASTWEQYVVRQKIGTPSGVYSILAVSNSLYVTVNSDGWLINNGEEESDSAGFYFIAT
jgi:endo-1,3(4)-beta-glucanase